MMAASNAFVIFSILQRADHCLRRETMTDGVAARAPFAFFCTRTGAFASIATVGINLSEGSHWGPVAIIGFVLVRPEGACHQRRRVPPRELSIDLVANERLGRVTGRAEAS